MDQALFSDAEQKDKSNRQKFMHSKFHLNMRYFFILWETKQWNRLPRETMESPSLEIFKGHQNRWKDRMPSVHYLKFPQRSSVFPLTLVSNHVETLKFLS